MNNENYPSLFNSADSLSVQKQADHLRYFKLHTALLILGASLAINPIPGWVYSLVNASVFLLALAMSLVIGSRRYERTWYSTRAVAESVKTATWRYMMQVEPFAKKGEEKAVESHFCKLLDRVLESNQQARMLLADEISDTGQITEFMKQMRAQSIEKRKAFYSKCRIAEQLQWYRAKAEFNNRKEKLFYYLLVATQCVAVALVLVRIAFSEWSIWPTEIFVVAAGSITAWVQLKRYQEHGAAYSLTANEIEIIQHNIKEVDTQGEFAVFVKDTENAFSREHTQWVVKADR